MFSTVFLQDAPVGSRVFQVVGADSDDPFTPEGQIQYLFLKSSPDVEAFNIGQSAMNKIKKEDRKFLIYFNSNWKPSVLVNSVYRCQNRSDSNEDEIKSRIEE